MSFDYAAMQARATALLTRFRQGSVQLRRTTNAAPVSGKPWDVGAGSDQIFVLSAVVEAVAEQYVDGTLIEGSEDQVTFAVPPVDPQEFDKLYIDGVPRPIKRLIQIPAAGTPVVYIAVVG